MNRELAVFGGLVGLALALWMVVPRPAGTDIEAYDPVAAGEELPDGFRQLLPRDAILPVYQPEFTAAGSAGWPEDAQVIGVASEGEAKAYPVSFLNRREMVIDHIAGDPILVSW